MLFVLWVPLLLQLVMPVGLLLWLAFGRPRNQTSWLLRVILVTSYLVGMSAGGLWLILPWYTPVCYGLVLFLAAANSLPDRTLPRFPKGWRGVSAALLTGLLTTFLAGLAWYILAGWHPPAGAVELSFPLRAGTYLVVNGGRHQLINAHLATLKGERFRPWRGQSYGVDIEKIDRYGFRARGILPADPTVYAIFGEPVYAPCAGEVIQAVDGVDEMPPPRMDREHMAGNHVLLKCGAEWILLGHLQKGSVGLGRGDSVQVQDWLGRVGNTGNSGEPHLHIHAQRPGTKEAPLSGEPLPIRFGNLYPVRNARIKAPPDAEAAQTPSAHSKSISRCMSRNHYAAGTESRARASLVIGPTRRGAGWVQKDYRSAPNTLMRAQACRAKLPAARPSAMCPAEGTTDGRPIMSPPPAAITPQFKRTNDSHASPSRPRSGPVRKRGRIQNATPSASWTIQPINRNSMCNGISRSRELPSGTARWTSITAPNVNPTAKCTSAARTNHTLSFGKLAFPDSRPGIDYE